MVAKMRENRLKWFGHMMKREETETIRVIMRINLEGRRGRGRPKKKWFYTIERYGD